MIFNDYFKILTDRTNFSKKNELYVYFRINYKYVNLF